MRFYARLPSGYLYYDHVLSIECWEPPPSDVGALTKWGVVYVHRDTVTHVTFTAQPEDVWMEPSPHGRAGPVIRRSYLEVGV